MVCGPIAGGKLLISQTLPSKIKTVTRVTALSAGLLERGSRARLATMLLIAVSLPPATDAELFSRLRVACMADGHDFDADCPQSISRRGQIAQMLAG